MVIVAETWVSTEALLFYKLCTQLFVKRVPSGKIPERGFLFSSGFSKTLGWGWPNKMLPDCIEAHLMSAMPPDKINTLGWDLSSVPCASLFWGFLNIQLTKLLLGNGVSGGHYLSQGNFVPLYWAGKWERVLSLLKLSLLLFGPELCACENSSFLRTTKTPDNGLLSPVRNTLCF